MIDRWVITGVNGVVGSAFTRRVVEACAGGTEVVGIFRSHDSCASFRSRAGAAVAARVTPVICDLTAPGAFEQLRSGLGHVERQTVVHAAADVSWDRSIDAMWGPNVEATRVVAAVARETATATRMTFVSSSFARPGHPDPRNAYEATKAASELLLAREFADLRPGIFACSLVVGSSADGRIDGFHGIYPLVRLVAAGVPFLVGSRTQPIDIVPVDWVADELLTYAEAAWGVGAPRIVVAGAGERAAPLPELVQHAERCLNRLRAEEGLPPLRPTPVVSVRQWRFLATTLEAWQVPGIDRRAVARFERLVSIYAPYLEDCDARAPRNVTSPAPHLLEYLDAVLTYWWRADRRRASRAQPTPWVLSA